MTDFFAAIEAHLLSSAAERADDAFDSFAASVQRLIRDVNPGRPSKAGNAAYEAMMQAVNLYRPIIEARARDRVLSNAIRVLELP